MKKLVTLILAIGWSYSFYAQQFQLISETESELVLQLNTNPVQFSTISIQGQDYVSFAKPFPIVTSELGAPEMPLFSTSIELPAKGNPTIEVVYGSSYIEFNNIQVAPSKGALKRNVNPSEVPFTFGMIYEQNAFFPNESVVSYDPFVFRSARGLTIQVAPYQYNPVTKVLRLYDDIQITVHYNTSESGVNEITQAWNDPISKSLSHALFLNRSFVRYTVKDEEGEMLIITHPDFEEEIMPFANWKNQKGIKTTVVNTTVSGTSTADIKSFVSDFFTDNPNTLYLVLVGDHQQIPAYSYGNSWGEELWSDSYYGQLLGNDYYPELFVGRISAENTTHVRTQVERTLEYEKGPLGGDWMEKAVGVGSNEGAGYGNLGLADWDHLRQMRTKLMDFGYTTVHEFYEGSQGGADAPGNPTVQMLQNAYNDGIGLWNYTGHGWEDGMSTCNYTGADANNATNYGMYPLVISVACNNGTFIGGTCVGEDFLRANAGGLKGAVGFAGSTILMSWAPPMQTQWEMTNILTEQNPNNVKRTVGGLFYNGQISMMTNYPGGSGHEVMQTWAYFGDPSVVFRHKQTVPLPISHNSQVSNGATSITVTSAVEDARIAVSQNNVLLGYGFVSGGTVTITFDALTTDAPLVVTATKQNHVSTQNVVQVGSGPLSLSDDVISFTIYPNPAQSTIYFDASLAQDIHFEIMNMAGQSIHSQQINGGEWSYDVQSLPQGMYFARIQHSGGVVTRPFQIVK